MKKIIPIIIILYALSFLSSCSKEDQSAAKTNKGNPAKLVQVAPAAKKTLKETLEVTGNVEPQNIANVIASGEGRITRLHVREGDQVTKDQTLALISPLLREDIINAARQRVNQIKNKLKDQPADALLTTELEQAEADLQYAREQYSETAVVAPISGVIGRRFIDVGDMVQSKSKLFEVQSAGQFKVNLTVSEGDLRKLKTGQQAALQLDGCPDREFSGVITRIFPGIDPLTRNGIAEVRLDNPCPHVKRGMFVRAYFITKVYKDVLTIPSQAIITKMDKKNVFIVDENMKAKSIEVKTGFVQRTPYGETKEDVEIISGLKQGDKVIIDGQQTLKNGDKVKIIHKESSGQPNQKEMK